MKASSFVHRAHLTVLILTGCIVVTLATLSLAAAQAAGTPESAGSAQAVVTTNPTPTDIPPTQTLAPPTPTPTPVPPTQTPGPPTPTSTSGQASQSQRVVAAGNSTVVLEPAGTPIPLPNPTRDPDTPTAADFHLVCTPETIVATVGGEPVKVSCDFWARASMGERQVTLAQLQVNVPDGWSITGDGAFVGDDFILPVNASIGGDVDHVTRFSLAPDGCETGSGSVNVTSAFTFNNSAPLPGPSVGISAQVSTPPALPPAIDAGPLVFGTSDKSGSAYPALIGTLEISFSGTGDAVCASVASRWVIQASTEGLYYGKHGEHIPAGALVFLGGPSSKSAPGWLAPVAGDVPLGSNPVTVAHSTGSTGAGGEWTVVFSITPPAGLPPGKYSGGITITVINAE